MDTSNRGCRVTQHGFYAKALRAHLRCGAGLVSIIRLIDIQTIVRFVLGGVVKNFRCTTQVLHTPYEQLDLGIVPGPPQLVEPAVSFDTHEVLQYPPDVVANAILAVPSTCLIHPNDPTWWDWSALHTASDGTIQIDFTLFDTEPVSWGGSELVFDCGPQSLFDFWLAIRVACPAAWLHDTSCKLYSPESFSEFYL